MVNGTENSTEKNKFMTTNVLKVRLNLWNGFTYIIPSSHNSCELHVFISLFADEETEAQTDRGPYLSCVNPSPGSGTLNSLFEESPMKVLYRLRAGLGETGAIIKLREIPIMWEVLSHWEVLQEPGKSYICERVIFPHSFSKSRKFSSPGLEVIWERLGNALISLSSLWCFPLAKPNQEVVSKKTQEMSPWRPVSHDSARPRGRSVLCARG